MDDSLVEGKQVSLAAPLKQVYGGGCVLGMLAER